MNITMNCGVKSFDSNLGLRKQKSLKTTENPSPAFKMAQPMKAQKGLVVALPVIIASLGIANNISKTESKYSKCNIPSFMPQAQSQINNVAVTVAGGDMTSIEADAYIVPQFDSCISEGGVGGAVMRGGAVKGMNDYGKYIKKSGNLNWSDVVLTKSGGGNSKYLIHTVTAGAEADNSFEVIQKAVYNSFKIAQQQGLQSMVIPAMGTGIIGHLTNEESANAIMAGINQFANEGGKMDVSVVVYSTGQGYRDFENVLKSKSYENAKPVTGTKEFDTNAFITEMMQTVHMSNIEEAEAKENAILELGASLKEPAFPKDFNADIMSVWAALNDLSFENDRGVAIFKDSDGNVVRRITENDYEKGKVYDDRVDIYSDGKVIARFVKYSDRKYAALYYGGNDDCFARKVELHEDGKLYINGTQRMLKTNPVTGKPQVHYIAYEKQMHPNGDYSLFSRDKNDNIIADFYKNGKYSYSYPYKEGGYKIVEGENTKTYNSEF